MDAQTGMPSVRASGATCVQKLDDSRNSAIHTTYRISLRSSSLQEPRYPLLRVHTFDNLLPFDMRSSLSFWLTRTRGKASRRGSRGTRPERAGGPREEGGYILVPKGTPLATWAQRRAPVREPRERDVPTTSNPLPRRTRGGTPGHLPSRERQGFRDYQSRTVDDRTSTVGSPQARVACRSVRGDGFLEVSSPLPRRRILADPSRRRKAEIRQCFWSCVQ